MLTPSVLPNSPLDHPTKKPVSAADTGETVQVSQPAGFGKLLSQEMSGEPDVPGVRSADINTSIQKNENRKGAAEGSERGGAPDPREDVPSLKNARKIKSAPSISTPSQPMDFSNVLPNLINLIVGRPVQVPAEVSAAAGAHASREHPVDAEAIDAHGYRQAEGEVGSAPRRKSGTPTDPLTDVSQAEQQGAGMGYATLAGQPPGLIHGNFTQAGPGAGPDKAAVHRAAPQVTGGVPAGASAGVVAGNQDEAPIIGRSAALQSGMATGLDSDAKQDGSKRPELSLMKPFTSELAKLSNASPDTSPQNVSAIQAEAALSTVAAEDSLAPISTAPAGSLDHSAPILEPRLGSHGWDNALGQKVLWMVSQQQHIAELSLNPPELGPLQVVLSVNNDQASAMFVSQNADVRQALEAALPRLREMMADSGINLGNTTVSSDSSQQSAWLEGFERRNHSGARYGGDDAPMSASDTDRAHLADISIIGLVDTFA